MIQGGDGFGRLTGALPAVYICSTPVTGDATDSGTSGEEIWVDSHRYLSGHKRDQTNSPGSTTGTTNSLSKAGDDVGSEDMGSGHKPNRDD